jgi:hypothetical protein
MGQSNVCYRYANGVLKSFRWIDAAIDFVNSYRGPNFLNAESDAEAASFDAQEAAAGFQPDGVIRNAVEEFAMARAREELCGMGFREFDNTSK